MASHRSHDPAQNPVLTDDERAAMKRWLDHWKVAGPILESERLAHLRALDDESAAREALLVWPLGTLAGDRRGDDGAGLEVIKQLQARLADR